MALSAVDPGAVRAGVMGVAGLTRLADPAVAVTFERAWRDAGLRCPMRVVADLLVAFVAATPAPSGTVLVAGTGAVAGRVDGRALSRVADGLGWLLGGEGSGCWLGRTAVREVARALCAGRRPGLLGRLVARRMLGAGPLAGPPAAAVRALVARCTGTLDERDAGPCTSGCALTVVRRICPPSNFAKFWTEH